MAAAGPEEEPQSVEESGALLGAAITRYGSAGSFSTINPPKGTHSSFSILTPVPSSELLMRLHSLRSLLRSAPTDTPLVAAPSLLAGVLMKLLAISSTLAAQTTLDPTRRTATPPMMSTPLRKLWVDCVVLCHTLGDGLSGNSRINIFGFVRNMMQLAASNPRTARAAGGTRVAALEVLAGIMVEEKLAKQLSSWALDVVQLCQRALKSSGNGEPSYRIAAIQTACSAAVSSRIAFDLSRSEGASQLVLKGALEDKCIVEMVRLLRIAAADKFPEVRRGGATLAGLLAPLVIHTVTKSPATPDAPASSPTVSLEEIMSLATKNLDDESPAVASAWADAFARCASTCIEYCQLQNAQKNSQRNVEGDDPGPAQEMDILGRTARKGIVTASRFSSLPRVINYLVSTFIRAGGELSAPRAGGSFSIGGRSVRHGLARTMVHLLRLQSSMNSVGEGKSISHKEAILSILSMVGADLDAQLNAANPLSGNPLFGQAPKVSPADSALARSAASRVLREGVSDLSTETIQINILHELVHLCESNQDSWKGSQLQVALIEISHLLATLGEAATSSLSDVARVLPTLLRHAERGVRHEAAVACAAMSSVFPSHGRQLVEESINLIQLEHAELMALASTRKAEVVPETSAAARFARFRRQSPVKEPKADSSMKHQHTVHGLSLMISMCIRDLPKLPGGLPVELLETVISVAQVLGNTMFDKIMITGNPSGACTCVRGGFDLFCGAMATGPAVVSKHITILFGLWQKVVQEDKPAKQFTDSHELLCVEAMLQSVVGFLKYCSELLLSVPDALSRTSLLLEQLLPLLFDDGRFGKLQQNQAPSSRLESAKAAILEAFAWLPPGSYPMVADSVFALSASQIQASIENDATCSILPTLLSKEDALLDAATFCRATRPGQVGGAKDLENDVIQLTSEVAHQMDRESAMHFFDSGAQKAGSSLSEFLGSEILAMTVSDSNARKPPTALHEVGTWRRPVNPASSSKVRLADASIQAFAATFTLKSGKEQQNALHILESLLPPAHMQSQRGMGVSSTLVDQGRRGKAKDDTVAGSNIAAVLLSCLRSLPIYESTDNVPIGLGPTWMNKAKDVFLAILPSPSHVVRRAAGEGLAFLATLGVKEDAHFLQSAVLYALDEVVQGNQSQEQAKLLSIDSVAGARSGALLTLGCMQRTAHDMRRRRDARTVGRGSGSGKKDTDNEDGLPLFQLLIKVLPSVAIRPTGGFLGARTFGLHAFSLLLAYTDRMGTDNLNPEEIHLLRKLVELVEDNFLSAWTTASADYDHGTEVDKLTSEAAFVAVLLRLMTFLMPSLYNLEQFDTAIARRFSGMAMVMLDCFGSHPTVQVEGFAFYEVLAKHRALLPPHASGVKYDEHPILCCIPTLMTNVRPRRSFIYPSGLLGRTDTGSSSQFCLRAALRVIKVLSVHKILVAEWSDMKIISLLYAALEETVGTRSFASEPFHRSFAAARETESVYTKTALAEQELSEVVRLLVSLERTHSRNCLPVLLRYILLSRSLLVGTPRVDDHDADDNTFTVANVVQSAVNRAVSDANLVLSHSNPVRWQVKALAVQVATIALRETAQACRQDSISFDHTATFNQQVASQELAKDCQKATANGTGIPESHLSLHAGTVVTAACVTATATVDQAELRGLQESAMHMVVQVIECFGGIPDPDQPDQKVLNDYIPQISSSIKGALVAPTEEPGEIPSRLFLVGCEALRAFLETRLSTDKAVMKRVVRPALPPPEEFPFFEMNKGVPSTLKALSDGSRHHNMRASLLVRLGRLWTLGSIQQCDVDLMAMVEADKFAVGVHAAALAIDGASLLLGTGTSLCGYVTESKTQELTCDSGFFYNSVSEIDDSVKAALSKLWASLAYTAVMLLADSVEEPDNKESAVAWLRKIVPLLFAGLSDSAIARKSSPSTRRSDDWAATLDAAYVASACIQGISTVSLKEGVLSLDDSWMGKTETAICQISESIFMPALTPKTGPDTTSGSSSELHLVSMACALFVNFAKNSSSSIVENTTLLSAILRPLDVVRAGNVNIKDKQVALVISACLTSAATVTPHPSMPSSLVKAVMALVLRLSADQGELPSSIKTSASAFLNACLQHEAITLSDQSIIATTMAQVNDWDTWSGIVRANEGLAAEKSLHVVQSTLLDSGSTAHHLALLGALRDLLQSTPPPSAFVGRVVCSVAAEVLAVFQAYGTLNVPSNARPNRTAACADCMKIALVAIQQFASDGASEEDIASFLAVFFERLIAVIRFNGLPNHPTPQPGSSDPAIGRMCAQAITYTARTTPNPSKVSMAQLSEHDRAVLELAVRADMSGYATAAAPAPAKKKLNLKSFQK